MGQLLTTPAWPPPDVATKAFYQTLKRDASVKVKRGTDCAGLVSEARLEGVRREHGMYWEGVGRGSLLERCVLEVVSTLLMGEGEQRDTITSSGRQLPPELVQLVVDVLRAAVGGPVCSRALEWLAGSSFYALVLGDDVSAGSLDVLFPKGTLERLVVASRQVSFCARCAYDDAFLIKYALGCRRLRVVHLLHCTDVTGVGVCRLLEGLPGLQEVRVVGCRRVREVREVRGEVGGTSWNGHVSSSTNRRIASSSLACLDFHGCLGLRRVGVLLGGGVDGTLRSLSLASCRSVKNVDAIAIAGLLGLEYLDVSYTGISDSGIAQLAALENLVEFKAAGVRAVDWSVAHAVRGMPRLRALDVSRTALVGNATLVALVSPARSSVLEVLEASFTSITDSGLARCLPYLKNLRRVDLESCNVETALVELRVCLRLEDVCIADTAAGNDVAEALSDLDGLRRLDVSFTPMVNDIGMRYLSKIGGLRELSMSTTDTVSSEAVRLLVKLPRLRRLDMSGCRISDTHCTFLGKMGSLRHLDLGGGEMTARGVERLSTLKRLSMLSLAHGRRIADDACPSLMRMSGLRLLNVSGCALSDRSIRLLAGSVKTLAVADRPLRCELVQEIVRINSDLELKGLKNS